jgi:alpha-beta hydrolase superfamily lysophospholipase
MAPKDPANTKAVVCFCHGYVDNASYMKRVVYQRLVKRGIAIVTIEYEGHGRSDGWSCLIPSWDVLIEDTATFFKETTDALFPGKKRFLLGEVRDNSGGRFFNGIFLSTLSHYVSSHSC